MNRNQSYSSTSKSVRVSGGGARHGSMRAGSGGGGGSSFRMSSGGSSQSMSSGSRRKGNSAASFSGGYSNRTPSRNALKAAYSGGSGSGGIGGLTLNSNFRGMSLHSTVPPNINMDVVPVRRNEKEQIKGLNDKFAGFITKVQQLEQQKMVLEAQWAALQQRGGTSVNVDGMFQDYINSLKQQLDGLGQDKMRLQGELQHMQGLVEDFKSRYEEEINNRTEKENEFVVVKKDVDDAYLAKVELEAKLDGLQDEIKFLKDIYAEEISQLEQQIKDTSLFVQVDTTRKLDANAIIQESQRHYDEIAQQSKQEAEKFYQQKVNEISATAGGGEDDMRKCKSEMNTMNQNMQRMRNEIEALKKLRADLEAKIAEAEQQGDAEMVETKARIVELERDLHKCKDEMAAQVKDYQILMNVKLALDIEIATYRTLLEGEENRIDNISQGISQFGGGSSFGMGMSGGGGSSFGMGMSGGLGGGSGGALSFGGQGGSGRSGGGMSTSASYTSTSSSSSQRRN
uniref:keratin, type II cytoskeletal 8-like n=1 Tax=Myxine glutinosa TaxID=7769 RepID=UPI0035900CF2